jgi:hypothetical protein
VLEVLVIILPCALHLGLDADVKRRWDKLVEVIRRDGSIRALIADVLNFLLVRPFPSPILQLILAVLLGLFQVEVCGKAAQGIDLLPRFIRMGIVSDCEEHPHGTEINFCKRDKNEL